MLATETTKFTSLETILDRLLVFFRMITNSMTC
jgi:hypothetical protein